MQTRSLAKIFWSLGYVIVAVVGLKVTAEPTAIQDAPRRDRTVVRKPWSNEPVKVVSAKNKKKNIDVGKAFDDDDDWLEGFAVTVFNGSDKVVTAMSISMIFQREPGDTRRPATMDVYFGPSPMSPEYVHRDRNKVIKPGETAEIALTAGYYQALKQLLQITGFPANTTRVEVVIGQVGFEDGSMLSAGTLFVQDPAHPDDPTKKIRANKKSHHAREVRDRHTHGRHHSMKIPASPPDGCHEIDDPHSQTCGGGCHTYNEFTEPFELVTTQLMKPTQAALIPILQVRFLVLITRQAA